MEQLKENSEFQKVVKEQRVTQDLLKKAGDTARRAIVETP